MNEMFLTTSRRNIVPHIKAPKKYFDYKESIEKILIDNGMDFEKAQILAIDNRPFLIQCFKEKKTTFEAVDLLLKK